MIAKKNDWLALVEAAAQADVTVEVLDCVVVPNGRTAATTKTYKDSKGKLVTTHTESRAINNYTVRAMMRAGKYENEMTGVVSSESAATWAGQWRSAAGQIAARLKSGRRPIWRDCADASTYGISGWRGRSPQNRPRADKRRH